MTQNITGVQRYAHEIISLFDEYIDKDLINRKEFELYIIAPKKNILFNLKFKHIKIKYIGNVSGHLWEQIIFPFFSFDGIQFNLGNTAPLLSLLFQKKTIVTLHDIGYLYYPKSYSKGFVLWYTFLVPFVTRFATKIIAVSQSEKNRIVEKYGHEKKIVAIQNGALDEAIANRFPKFYHKEKYILYAGSLNTKKNIQGAVEAFKMLSPRFPEYSLVVVGTSEKSFAQIDFNLNEETKLKIRFAGRVSDEELFSLYNKASCFLFPSFYEASPFPPLEAMALGCPVVVTNIDSLQERCGNAALFANPANSHEIASQIGKVLESEMLRIDLQNKGYEQVKVYTWEKCAQKTFDLILNF